MRVLAIFVILLGLVGVVFGILFLPMANSAEQTVADSIAPNLTIDLVDPTYDALTTQFKAMTGAEPDYLMVLAQRTSVGLAKSNIGMAKLIRYLGILSVCVGAGLTVAGFLLMRKA